MTRPISRNLSVAAVTVSNLCASYGGINWSSWAFKTSQGQFARLNVNGKKIPRFKEMRLK